MTAEGGEEMKSTKMFFAISLILVFGVITIANAGQTLKIGVLVPLSGPSVDGGTRMHESIKMAAEEINESGGVLGKKIELEVWDTETKVEKGITGAKKLILKDKVWGLIGGFRSGVTLGYQPFVMEQKKILMVTDSASNEITDRVGKEYDTYKYTFRSVMNVSQVGQLMLPVLTDIKDPNGSTRSKGHVVPLSHTLLPMSGLKYW